MAVWLTGTRCTLQDFFLTRSIFITTLDKSRSTINNATKVMNVMAIAPVSCAERRLSASDVSRAAASAANSSAVGPELEPSPSANKGTEHE